MKLRIISDIHVEFYSSTPYIKNKLDKLFWDGKVHTTYIEDEILVIAGDLGVAGTGLSKDSLNKDYKDILQYFSERWKYVILVPGNHEYYDRDKDVSLEDVDKMIEKECDKLGITFLNKNYVMIPESLKQNDVAKSSGLDVKHPKDRYAKNGVAKDRYAKNGYAVLGCTLWSEATKEAYKGMNDRLKAILSHKELLKIHNEHKLWLKNTLKRLHKKGIKTIVITHHLPLMELTHPKYLTEKYKHLNSAYASDLKTLFEDSEICTKFIPFYCCGHTHEKTETNLYGVNFLINPLGYPREKRITKVRFQCIEI